MGSNLCTPPYPRDENSNTIGTLPIIWSELINDTATATTSTNNPGKRRIVTIKAEGTMRFKAGDSTVTVSTSTGIPLQSGQSMTFDMGENTHIAVIRVGGSDVDTTVIVHMSYAS